MYLDVIKTSEVLGIALNNVRKAIRHGRFVSRKVSMNNGSKRFKYEIELESLPIEAQQRYWQQRAAEQEAAAAKPRRGRPSRAAVAKREAAKAEAAAEVQANSDYLTAPAWQRERVDYRLSIVTATMELGRAELQQWLNNHAAAVSVSTVYRWRKAYLNGGKNALFTALGNRAGDSIIPDDVFEVFEAVYLAEGQVSVRGAYIAALGYLKEHYNFDKLPKEGAFEYRLKQRTAASVRYRARYGEAAWNRKFARSITRDYTKLACGDCVFSDHMQLDLIVSLPDGSTCRPWLTAWTDFKSRKLLGWDLHAAAPNSDHIFTSFRAMVQNFGLPKHIYIDNGKDYRCKDFAGGRVRVDVDEQRTTSLMADLGIGVNYAIPYNAQAKNIERRFRDFHGYFERTLEGYTGTNVVKRPECLKN